MAKKVYDDSIPMIRVHKKTRVGLEKMGREDDRELTDFVRLKLEKMVEEWEERKKRAN